MNTKFLTTLLFVILVFSSIEGYSQSTETVAVINYFKFKFPDEVSVPEFDSLALLYSNQILSKNEFILDFKILRHWWGNRDNEFIIMYEVQNWETVIKATTRNNELFEESWSTQEERDKFNAAFNKYFTSRYPDEVFQVISKKKLD